MGIPFEGSEGEFKAAKQTSPFAALVAMSPSFPWNPGDGSWLVRGSVSITSHNLQGQTGRSKIWLTLAGMPSDGYEKDEASTSIFLDRINKLEGHELETLKNCYRKSLEAISNEHAKALEFEDTVLKISVSDDDTRAVASLVDAIYFDGVKPEQISVRVRNPACGDHGDRL